MREERSPEVLPLEWVDQIKIRGREALLEHYAYRRSLGTSRGKPWFTRGREGVRRIVPWGGEVAG